MDKNEIRAENITLICLLRTLKKNLWMIVAAAAIFAMLVSLYADFVRKPVYRASMTYAVTSRMSGYSTRNIGANGKPMTYVKKGKRDGSKHSWIFRDESNGEITVVKQFD